MRIAITIASYLLLISLFVGCGGEKPPLHDPVPTSARNAATTPAPTEPGGFQPNLSVTIHAEAINNLLQAIGTLSKTRHVGPKTGLTTYSLEVPPPTVEIIADSALMRTNVTVKALGTEYTTEAVGGAHVTYDPKLDQLFLDIGKLTVDVHMKPLGIPINLDNVDISDLYQPRIKLLGNLPLATDFKVKKPDTGKEPIQIKITRHQISYRPGVVILDMVVDFTPGATSAPPG